MLKGLKDVLWRGKADFSIWELERQKEFSNNCYLGLMLVCFFDAIATFFILSCQESSEYNRIITLIGSVILISGALIMFVLVKRDKLCQKMIDYKYKEKKKKAVLYYIKKQELINLELVDKVLQDLLYRMSVEQEGVHLEIVTEQNVVLIKINGRIIERIYTWEDKLLNFLNPIIDEERLRILF